jgi:hypothetical protein
MTHEKPPPGTIPTLTEVVSWPESAPAAPPAWAAPPVQAPAATPAEPSEPPSASSAAPSAEPSAEPEPEAQPAGATTVPAAVTEAQITRRVMADLQGQLDLMLEVRVRETLAPILARAGDAIVRDARKELTAALREIVSLSVCRELRRRDDS